LIDRVAVRVAVRAVREGKLRCADGKDGARISGFWSPARPGY